MRLARVNDEISHLNLHSWFPFMCTRIPPGRAEAAPYRVELLQAPTFADTYREYSASEKAMN